MPGEFVGAAPPGRQGPGCWSTTSRPRGLGPAIAWTIRHGATELQLVAEAATGVLARRAPAFDLPIEVWHVPRHVLLPAIAEPLPSRTCPPDHERSVS